MITLPKTREIKDGTLNSYKTIIYGQPKIGKTEVLAQLKDFLIIDLEDGSNHLRESMVIKANNLKELTDIGRAIMAEGRPYKGIIIDTITELEDWCEEDATEMYMSSTMGKNFNRDKQGRLLPREEWASVISLGPGGYLWFRKSFNKWLDKINKLADYIIYVAHVRDKYLGEDSDTTVSPKELDLTGKNQRIAFKEVDSIGYIYRTVKDPLQLRISFKNDPDVFLAGSRCKHLRNQDLLLAINNEDGSIAEHHWDKIFK